MPSFSCEETSAPARAQEQTAASSVTHGESLAWAGTRAAVSDRAGARGGGLPKAPWASGGAALLMQRGRACKVQVHRRGARTAQLLPCMMAFSFRYLAPVHRRRDDLAQFKHSIKTGSLLT